MDQKLTAMNRFIILVQRVLLTRLCSFRALAKDCCAGIDDKNGAEAKAWRKGKPVRVVGVVYLWAWSVA